MRCFRDVAHTSLFVFSDAVSQGGVRRAVPPALEKPFSVFWELFLKPLSRRDVYSTLDFSPGLPGAGWKQPSPLGHFSTKWALKTWEGCGSRKECGGVPKLCIQTVITPPFFCPSLLSLSLHLPLSIFAKLVLLAWHERWLLPKHQDKRYILKPICCLTESLCLSLPQYPFPPPSSSSPPVVAASAVYIEARCL